MKKEREHLLHEWEFSIHGKTVLWGVFFFLSPDKF